MDAISMKILSVQSSIHFCRNVKLCGLYDQQENSDMIVNCNSKCITYSGMDNMHYLFKIYRTFMIFAR